MFWFKAGDGTLLYMGKDKFENEDLIKYHWPEDIWFHVDGLSSAHVYARILAPGSAAAIVCGAEEYSGSGGGAAKALPPPPTLDAISEEALKDCAQLVKANSIEGCKKGSVVVIYTLASNLKKDGSMAPGQVGFINERAVKRVTVEERDKELLSRLAKTREETHPDFAQEREKRNAMERNLQKAFTKARSSAERTLADERRKEKEERSYDRLFNEDELEKRAAQEKERMKKLAARAVKGEEEESVAISKGVRAVEEDFM